MCTPPEYVNYRLFQLIKRTDQIYVLHVQCTLYSTCGHRAEPYIIFEAHNAYFYIHYRSAYLQIVCFFLWTQAGTSAHYTKTVHVNDVMYRCDVKCKLKK